MTPQPRQHKNLPADISPGTMAKTGFDTTPTIKAIMGGSAYQAGTHENCLSTKTSSLSLLRSLLAKILVFGNEPLFEANSSHKPAANLTLTLSCIEGGGC
jgi:hypothetical protein